MGARLKRDLAPGLKPAKKARKTRRRKTPWRKTQAKTPAEALPSRPETSSAAAIRRMVNSEEWMAANDVAPGETEAASPVPMAAANDATGEAGAINQILSGQMPSGQTASRERWVAASDDAGEVEATAAPMAQAAGNGAPGETGAINQTASGQTASGQIASGRTANREPLTALGGQGRVAPALAQRAAQSSGATRRAEAGSVAPTERAIATCRQLRRFRTGKDASYGCSAQTTNHNRAWSGSASLTALRRK